MLTNKKILTYYVIISVVTCVFYLVPIVTAILSIFTLGLFALIPNIWLYFTLLLPVILLHPNSPKILAMKALSIALTVFIGIGIPIQRNRNINFAIENLLKDDFEKLPSTKPKHLKFITYGLWNSDPKYKEPELKSSECDRLCQRLLLNGEVESITIEATDKYRKRQISVVKYHMERRARCPDAFSKSDVAIMDVVLQSMLGNCIVAEIGQDMQNGILLEEQSLALDEGVFPRSLHSPSASRLIVSDIQNQISLTIIQRTSISYERTQIPLMFGPFGGLFTTVSGWKLFGTKAFVNSNTLSTAAFVESTFKISATPPNITNNKHVMDVPGFNRMQPNEETVVRLLNDQNPEAFNQEVNMAITSWVSNLMHKKGKQKLTPHETNLIEKIAADGRIRDFYFVSAGLRYLLQTSPDKSKLIVDRLCDPTRPLANFGEVTLIELLKKHKSLPNIEKSIRSPEQMSEFRANYCN